MPQFHEGQEVEVAPVSGVWRKAKIARKLHTGGAAGSFQVEFDDGTRAVFNADHIRVRE